MNTRPYNHAVRCALLAGQVGLLACPAADGSALQRPSSVLDRPVQLNAAGVTFAQCLQRVQAQCGLSFVADGCPVYGSEAVQVRGTVRDALDRAADAFDYTWRVNGNVVLLNKRFRNPFEMPQANLEEYRAVAGDVLAVLQALRYDTDEVGWEKLLVELADSLTPEQMAALKSGAVLQSSRLQPRQFDVLYDAILCNALARPRVMAARLVSALNTLPASAIELTKYGSGEDFSIQLTRYVDRPEAVCSFNVGFRLDADFPPTEADDGAVPPVLSALAPCATAPIELHMVGAQDRAGRKPSVDEEVWLEPAVLTAGQLAGAISQQAGVTIHVDSAIRGRELVAALQGVSVRDALTALAQLEDWRFVELTPADVYLERRRSVLPRGLSAVPEALLRVLPVDLRTYLYCGVSPAEIRKDSGSPIPLEGFDDEAAYRAQTSRGGWLAYRLARAMASAFAPDYRRGARVEYSRLSPALRRAVLLDMVVSSIPETVLRMFRDGVAPYQRDPRNAMMWMEGAGASNLFMAGNKVITPDSSSETGFGTPLTPEHGPPSGGP